MSYMMWVLGTKLALCKNSIFFFFLTAEPALQHFKNSFKDTLQASADNRNCLKWLIPSEVPWTKMMF